MNEIKIINGVQAYIDENGTAYLNFEDVAKGLGFIQEKNGVKYIRWERINKYLDTMGFPQLVGKEYIPENVFYRLAMKGENRSAVAFQNKVADEILPAIRKAGKYEAQQAVEQPSNKELSFEERLKLIETIAMTPEYALDGVMAIAKTYIEEEPVEIKPQAVPNVEVLVPQPVLTKQRMKSETIASSTGYTTPFKLQTLKNYMRRNNITHTELAKLADVNRSTMNAVLRDRQSPGMETRHKICKALGKPNGWLNGGA